MDGNKLDNSDPTTGEDHMELRSCCRVRVTDSCDAGCSSFEKLLSEL